VRLKVKLNQHILIAIRNLIVNKGYIQKIYLNRRYNLKHYKRIIYKLLEALGYYII